MWEFTKAKTQCSGESVTRVIICSSISSSMLLLVMKLSGSVSLGFNYTVELFGAVLDFRVFTFWLVIFHADSFNVYV